jgi:4-amino-4-deoxychorismate lyase
MKHCDRLQTSVQTFSWQQPDWQQVRRGAEALVDHFPVLRIVLFPDGREWITGRLLPADLAERQQAGIIAWLAETPLLQRTMPAHKTGSYLPGWLALQTAQQRGAQEAILIDTVGNWLETSGGNLWGWYQGHWWTPPLKAGILPGLMRSQLIHWLLCQNEIVEEELWSADRVKAFEAIAYTNSVMEVVPIHTVLRECDRLSYDPSHRGFEQLRGLFQTNGY